MKRKTRVVLEIQWDDETTDHPAGWDYRTLLWGDPFGREGSHEVKLLDYAEVEGHDGEPKPS